MTTMRELTQEVNRLNEVITQLALEVGALKLQVAGMQQPTYEPVPTPWWPTPQYPHTPHPDLPRFEPTWRVPLPGDSKVTW